MNQSVGQVYVGYKEWCSTTRDADPEDAWDRDDTETYFELGDVTLEDRVDQTMRKTVRVTFEPYEGQQVWVIVVRYDTGDSFGRDENVAEIVGVVDSADVADRICRLIHEDDGASHSLELPEDLVSEIDNYHGKIYSNWSGYFELYRSVEAFQREITGGSQYIKYGK